MAPSRMRSLLNSLHVDESTGEMSDVALFCRARGHRWVDQAISRRRYNELLLEGLMEDVLVCDNGCGCTWTATWDVRTGEIVQSQRGYPKDKSYLMPKGLGRLHRSSARVARAARLLASA